jgi:FAD-dependent urate hydroxylase
MKAIVIGAGMAGLSAGIALRQIGCEVEIYDQVAEMRPVGAAISLWSNGVKCLNRLGLARQIAEIGGHLETMAYLDAHSGATLTGFSIQPLIDAVGQRPYPVARADLQAMLMAAFGPADVHLGARLARLADDGRRVRAHFVDGRSAEGDLLVGADGTHSLVRSVVLGEVLSRRYAGYVNWNGLLPIADDLAPATQWTTYVGESKRVSLMPVAGGRFYFFFDVPLAQGVASDKALLRDELRRHFSGWAAPVLRLIERLDPATTNRVEVHDIEPFHTFAKGRTVLVGDAAHSTTPDLGQGGCQAMEDAIVLATALQTHTLGIEDALRRYQDRRRNRVADLVLKARKRCDITHGKDLEATRRWYAELKAESGSNILNAIAANVQGGPLG